jgi:nuclear transport factor 2 (NTF2) superfamily protein
MFIEKNEKPFAIPPFNEESARSKVKAAEEAWNSKDPDTELHFSGATQLHNWGPVDCMNGSHPIAYSGAT